MPAHRHLRLCAVELRDLRAYAAVVELGGMTRAARRLHVVQSSVSQAVKRLELEFGIELLERRPDGVRPTAAGAELAWRARRMLEEASRLEADMASYRGAAKGGVSVGMATTLSPIVLASLIRRVDMELPDVTLHVEEGVTSELLEALRLGRLDLVLVVLPLDPEGMQVVTTGTLDLFFVLPPAHPLAGRSEVELGELEHEPWVTFPPSNPARRWVDDNCRHAGFRPLVSAEVKTMTQLKAFVEAGHGIALLPRKVAELELLTGRLCAVPAAAPKPAVGHGYVYDPGNEPRPGAAHVRALAESELRELAT
jgi:DNA-binding transcriptional LysR family regulator